MVNASNCAGCRYTSRREHEQARTQCAYVSRSLSKKYPKRSTRTHVERTETYAITFDLSIKKAIGVLEQPFRFRVHVRDLSASRTSAREPPLPKLVASRFNAFEATCCDVRVIEVADGQLITSHDMLQSSQLHRGRIAQYTCLDIARAGVVEAGGLLEEGNRGGSRRKPVVLPDPQQLAVIPLRDRRAEALLDGPREHGRGLGARGREARHLAIGCKLS